MTTNLLKKISLIGNKRQCVLKPLEPTIQFAVAKEVKEAIPTDCLSSGHILKYSFAVYSKHLLTSRN